MLSWALTYPQDVIKSRMQVRHSALQYYFCTLDCSYHVPLTTRTFQADANGKYKGVVHCLKASVAAEGGVVLWRGLGSALIRAFPVNAVNFGVYSMVFNHFSRENSADSVVRKGTSWEPTFMEECATTTRTEAAVTTVTTLSNRQTPTAMVPMLYTEQSSAEGKVSESESGAMVGTMRHPVPLSAVLHFLESRLIPAIDWICHYRAAMEMRVHGNITLQM